MKVKRVFKMLLIANMLIISTTAIPMLRKQSKSSIEEFHAKRECVRQDRHRLTVRVLQLVKLKGNVNAQANVDGNTFVHEAAKNGLVSTLKLLITAKSDINAINHHGKTPLHLAAENLKLDVIQVLLYAGANYDIATPEGLTIRTILAADQGSTFEEYLLSGFIKSGSCINYVDQLIEKVNASGADQEIAMTPLFTSRTPLSDIDEKEEQACN